MIELTLVIFFLFLSLISLLKQPALLASIEITLLLYFIYK
jgi:hypothetical protein